MSGLTDDELCNDRPCTCGAAIHDPVELAKAARGWRIALGLDSPIHVDRTAESAKASPKSETDD